MKRISAIILLLLLSVWTLAQGTQSPQARSAGNAAPAGNTGITSNTGTSAPAGPAMVPSTIIITGQNGLSTNTGTAVILAPPSAPLVVTPEFHLAPALTSVGATNATPGNSAGAVNSTAELPQPPRISTTIPQFAIAGASVTETVPAQEPIVGGVSSGTAMTNGVPVVILNGNNGSNLNLGVGSGSGLNAGATSRGKSLGEIARENRQRDTGINAHVYTNQDIERINQQPSTTIGGTSGAAVGAGATSQPRPSGNMPAVAQPPTTPAPNPGVSQPVPPAATTPPPQGQAIAPWQPAAPDANEDGEMAEAHFPPTDAVQRQVAPSAAEHAATSSDGQTLPGGGSILPLTAIVGFLATGAGLLAK